jgi:hypothetical protein
VTGLSLKDDFCGMAQLQQQEKPEGRLGLRFRG